MKKLEETVAEYKTAVAALDSKNPTASLRRAIDVSEAASVLLRRLAGFFSLRRSTNATDTAGALYMTKIQALMASNAKEGVIFDKFVGSLPDLDAVIAKDEILSQYKFYFNEIKQSVSHKMSDEAEEVFAKMGISGGKAWGDLFSYLTASVEVDYKGEKTTLSAIRGLAESDDATVRREAYEAELACYSKIRDSIAFALNSIKAQVNTEAELRRYDSPLDMTLADSRMERATLEAMLEAMREYLPKFHEYLRHKAKLLGHENGLPWYDLFAPMGKSSSAAFTVEDAHKYIVEHFGNFAPDLAEMADRAFKEEWIDFYPRSGQVGGAF